MIQRRLPEQERLIPWIERTLGPGLERRLGFFGDREKAGPGIERRLYLG